MSVDKCVICGEPIPEGRQVCPLCENQTVNENPKRRKWKMKIVLDKGAIMPTRAHASDAGYDLYARERQSYPPKSPLVSIRAYTWKSRAGMSDF